MVLVLALFAGHLVFGDDYEKDIEKLKSQFPEAAGVIPEGLPFDKVLGTLKKKCEQEAGSDAAFEEAKQAGETVQKCLTGLMDWNTLLEEVEKAKPTGDLEIVFNKYCRRRYTAMDCVRNFTESISPCLSEPEIEHKKMFEKMMEQLFGFVCYKDGDQIALFIAEKGPECFGSKKDEMFQCVNETYGEPIAKMLGMKDNFDPKNVEIPDTLPVFTIEKEECEKLEMVEACITKVLEACEETTPANLFQSAAKFVRNESPCKNVTRRIAQPRTGGGAEDIKALPLLIGAAIVAAAAATKWW